MRTIQQLLTDHLDIWTAAEAEKKSGRGRSGANSFNIYGIKKLRELILDLAMRGKLVPQDSMDEPSSELLTRIQNEKSKLIAEGTIKKSKPLEPITEDEKLFVIPQGWEWVRLGEVCSYIQRGKGPAYVDKSDFIVVSQKCVRWSGLDLSQARYIDPESITKYEKIRQICKGDILWNSTGTGTIGRACFVSELEINKILFADSHVTIVRPIIFSSLFLSRWIQSPTVQSKIEDVASGTTNQIELNTSTVISHLLPLPPLAEQERIVTKVDELMKLCDLLETKHNNAAEAHEKLVGHLLSTLIQSQNAEDFNENWQRIAMHFHILFTTEYSIDVLEQTLLQLAIMGKLVSQDPEEQLNTEEQKELVKSGEFKLLKPIETNNCAEDEKLHNIPKKWNFVTLGEIASIKGGKRLPKGDCLTRVNTGHIYIRVTDMANGTIKDTDLHYITDVVFKKISQYIITRDDIYFTIVGATIGKLGLVPEKFHNMNLTENAARITPLYVDKHYLCLCMNSSFCQNQFNNKTKQVGVQKIALTRLKSTIIPLPPLAEQKRIVIKLDELMRVCEQLKSRIVEANLLQKRLAKLIVGQSLCL